MLPLEKKILATVLLKIIMLFVLVILQVFASMIIKRELF